MNPRLALLISLLPLAAAGADLPLAASILPLPKGSSGLAAADFDGDGDLDFASVDTDGVFMVESLTANCFQIGPERWPTNTNSTSLQAADFNADGKPDLLASAPTGGMVAVLLNEAQQGVAAFGQAIVYDTAFGPTSLQIDDFDADGDLDFIVARQSSLERGVILYRGNNTGFFAASTFSPLPDPPSDARAIDLDADGSSELLVRTPTDSSNIFNLLVLDNDGNGAFAPGQQLGQFFTPDVGPTLDADNDGDLDVVIKVGDDVITLLNDAAGTLVQGPGIDLSTDFTLLDTGDLDGDGHVDVLLRHENVLPGCHVGNSVDYQWLGVLRNTGGGVFLPPDPLVFTELPTLGAITDIDADGDMDLAAFTFEGGDDGLLVLVNDGTQSFGVTQIAVEDGDLPSELEAVDVTGDGLADLVSISLDAKIAVRPGTLAGLFAPPIVASKAQVATSLATSDMTGDGLPEVVVADPVGGAVLVLAFEGGAPSLLSSTPLAAPLDADTGDVDGDGLADVVAASPSANLLTILPGTGDGRFAPTLEHVAMPAPDDVLLEDVDGDGDAEIALRLILQDRYVILDRDGPGELVEIASLEGVERVAFADFTADGLPELVIVAPGFPAIRENLGGGAFGPPEQLADVIIDRALIADVDLDNDDDLLTFQDHGLSALLFRNDGAGELTPFTRHRIAARIEAAALADLDRDSDPDLVVVDEAAHEIVTVTNLVLTPCPPDVNGDGETNVLDFTAFQQAFAAAQVLADCDASGTLDVFDFICFQSLFMEGCP